MVAANGRKKRPILTTPVLVLKWPKLIVPDEFKGKRLFKTEGLVPRDEAEPLIQSLMRVMEEARAEAEAITAEAKDKARRAGKRWDGKAPTPGRLYHVEVDETGEETGRIVLRFKTAAERRVVDKATGQERMVPRVIPFFSASGAPIPVDKRPDLWGGSRARIAFTPDPYFVASTGEFGVTLRIEAVKIIEARTGSSRTADDFGLGGREDGYEPEDSAADDEGGDLPGDADTPDF